MTTHLQKTGILIGFGLLGQVIFAVFRTHAAYKYKKDLDQYYWNLYGISIILLLQLLLRDSEIIKYLNYLLFALAGHFHLRNTNPKKHPGLYHSLKILMLETGTGIYIYTLQLY